MPHLDRYLLFVEYFNSRKFMAAQTTLDRVWLKEEGKNREFYEGLIQVAVSMFHLVHEKNPEGAKRIFEKAKALLAPYDDKYLDLEVGKC